MWYLWLIAAGIFFVIEILTTGFLIFWLGLGSIFAMITSIFIDSIFIQTAVFVFSSVILIFLTKPIISKYVDTKKVTPTNAYSVIGKIGVVIQDINSIDCTGQVKVNGEIWSAKSEENIVKGTEVEILKIDGVKLVVKSQAEVKI